MDFSDPRAVAGVIAGAYVLLLLADGLKWICRRLYHRYLRNRGNKD